MRSDPKLQPWILSAIFGPPLPIHPRARVTRSPWGWTFRVVTGPDMDAIHAPLVGGPYSTHDMAMTEAARYVAAYRRKKDA